MCMLDLKCPGCKKDLIVSCSISIYNVNDIDVVTCANFGQSTKKHCIIIYKIKNTQEATCQEQSQKY